VGAQHNKQDEVFRWMRAHCAVGLHETVCFDLREHIEARLREDPASINTRRDQREIPQCNPRPSRPLPERRSCTGT
jgi:hypothetical protein